MISSLITGLTRREQDKFYSLLNNNGRVQLTNLLVAERELISIFNLDYPTPELRRIAGKVSNGKATQAEVDTLNKSVREFTGTLNNNVVIESKEAIGYIKSLIAQVNSLSSFTDSISSSTKGGIDYEMMILGQSLTEINLNPMAFINRIFDRMFIDSLEVKVVLESLIDMRSTEYLVKVFDHIDDLLNELIKLGIDTEAKAEYIASLSRIKVDSVSQVSAVKSIILKLISRAVRVDSMYNNELHDELNLHVPQYHCVNVDYLFIFLVSYLGAEKPYLTPIISSEVISTLYRKGVEVIASN